MSRNSEVLMGFAMVLANLAFFGGIALLVWLDQRGKTQRRQLEHTERMRALELGRPLEDAEVARYKALGAIGVAVPIASMSAAMIGTSFVFLFQETEYRYKALVVIWLVCGLMGLISFPAVIKRLKQPNAKPLIPPDPEQPAAVEWKAQPSEQFRPGDRPT